MKDYIDFHGSNVEELFRKSGYSPQQGYWLQQTWKGKEANIEAIIPTLVANGFTFTMEYGPLCTLTATLYDNSTAAQAEATVRWNLSAINSDKDFLVAENGLDVSDWDTQAIRRWASNPVEGMYPAVQNASGITATQLYEFGVTTTVVTQPVIRRSTIIGINDSLDYFYAYQGQVMPISTFLSYENVPSNYSSVLPSPATTTVTKTGTLQTLTYTYGWLKMFATADDYSFNRQVVNNEWVYGLWSNDLYTIA